MLQLLRTTILDPRPESEAQANPVRHSVNIPAGQLDDRTYELPPKSTTVLVANFPPFSAEAIRYLNRQGRPASLDDDFRFGLPESPCRLWAPNSFLEEELPIQPGRAIDLACGAGRDAVFLASMGWMVDALDNLPDALARGRDLANRYLERPESVQFLSADLRIAGNLPLAQYDLAVCFFFYHRALFEEIAHIMAPGGLLLIESFSERHRAKLGKPSEGRVFKPQDVQRIFPKAELQECRQPERQTYRAIIRF